MLGGVPDSLKTQFPDDSTRFLFKAEADCCTYGYAVSNRGAKKILAQLELDHIEVPVDLALSDLCGGKGRRQIDCYAPFPQIIGTYRQAGPPSRDSDISSSETSVIREEESVNTVYSTRRNIQRLVAGDATVFSQWDDQPWREKEKSAQKNLSILRGIWSFNDPYSQ
jgi:GR25 family glycosyltransferase involved in LPS biosynthesis